MEGASASAGDGDVGVYSDPESEDDVLLFPGCWLIRRDEEEVLETSCPFRVEGDDLLFDSTWRSESGRLGGVAWDDPKRGVSLFSRLFRRPKFGATTVKFWSGSEWVVVTGLPARE